jgi:hypothetical protein
VLLTTTHSLTRQRSNELECRDLRGYDNSWDKVSQSEVNWVKVGRVRERESALVSKYEDSTVIVTEPKSLYRYRLIATNVAVGQITERSSYRNCPWTESSGF